MTSLPPPPAPPLHIRFPPSVYPFRISLMVSVDVKHHVYFTSGQYFPKIFYSGLGWGVGGWGGPTTHPPPPHTHTHTHTHKRLPPPLPPPPPPATRTSPVNPRAPLPPLLSVSDNSVGKLVSGHSVTELLLTPNT